MRGLFWAFPSSREWIRGIWPRIEEVGWYGGRCRIVTTSSLSLRWEALEWVILVEHNPRPPGEKISFMTSRTSGRRGKPEVRDEDKRLSCRESMDSGTGGKSPSSQLLHLHLCLCCSWRTQQWEWLSGQLSIPDHTSHVLLWSSPVIIRLKGNNHAFCPFSSRAEEEGWMDIDFCI